MYTLVCTPWYVPLLVCTTLYTTLYTPLYLPGYTTLPYPSVAPTSCPD